MYFVKSYKITLMHLLTVVIFAHSVKTKRTFFFIAIANDTESTQKKQRPSPNPNNIKTDISLSKRKSTNRPKITFYYNLT